MVDSIVFFHTRVSSSNQPTPMNKVNFRVQGNNGDTDVTRTHA